MQTGAIRGFSPAPDGSGGRVNRRVKFIDGYNYAINSQVY